MISYFGCDERRNIRFEYYMHDWLPSNTVEQAVKKIVDNGRISYED